MARVVFSKDFTVVPDKKESPLAKRFCVSFNDAQVGALQEMADRNDVSVSWLVRYAVEEFLENHSDPQLRLDFQMGRKP